MTNFKDLSFSGKIKTALSIVSSTVSSLDGATVFYFVLVVSLFFGIGALARVCAIWTHEKEAQIEVREVAANLPILEATRFYKR